MLFHISQLICPLKGANNWKRGMLTEEQALWIPHKLQRTAVADEWVSTTAPEGTQSHFCGSSGAVFAHSHLFRREEQVQFQNIVLRLDDGTGQRACGSLILRLQQEALPWAWWLQSQV